ncbi:hypothetical protein MFFC18_20970 [Mariniblastus fucicola]|uniref:Uncharacterized protein n=1 Tax=Mariniblastus fucicola TaxID=980251 RepID=A0A5B9PH85_9BACT|nr:hypothetical protein MFFC18_20970 [Mariniblastus fucicola]
MLTRSRSILLALIVLTTLGCTTREYSAKDDKTQMASTDSPLPNGYVIIDEARRNELNAVPFNDAVDGMETESRFTDEFAAEIADTMERFSKVFSKYGEFGSLERYEEKLPSDWWIGDDFYSTSRVLSVDILNPKLQDYKIVEDVRRELRKLESEWMLLMTHDNSYDALGDFVDRDGSYSIWIRSGSVEIFSERPEDIENLINSLPPKSGG